MSRRQQHRDAVAAAGPVMYQERLRTPWWWYLVGIGVSGVLAAEFHVAGFPLTDWIPFGVMVPLSVLLVWWFGHSTVEVRDGQLWVRGAHLPLDVVSGVVALDAPTMRRVVGREGDPAAFIAIRPWIGPGVQLWLDDPEDPVPYWAISTREPQRLVEVVRRHIDAGEAPGGR